MVSPITFALVRLITSSNLVGCSIGMWQALPLARSCQQVRLLAGITPAGFVRRTSDLRFRRVHGYRRGGVRAASASVVNRVGVLHRKRAHFAERARTSGVGDEPNAM